jgi:hypothetical protein
MEARAHRRLRLACAIVWSLDAGISFTILLGVLRAAQIALALTNILLRPSFYLLDAVYGATIPSNAAFAFCDAAIYGLLVFVGVHLWSSRHRAGLGGAVHADRRRGSRVSLDARVFVYGWLQDEPFSESTATVDVSELGVLIPLSVKLAPSQELVLTNLQTDQDMRCRVARSITRDDGKSFAGLTFLQASPSFWQIEFLSKAPHSLFEPHSGRFQDGRREKANPSVANPTSG